MGKQRGKPSLGKSLVGTGGQKLTSGPSGRHSSNEDPGQMSILEATDLDDLMMQADLSGRDFMTERTRAALVLPMVDGPKNKAVKRVQDKTKLRIPRRPAWDANTSAADLEREERAVFLQWRSDLAQIEEVEGQLLTPFEKNVEVWRQLWRVVERSDALVQIVDARDPLLYYCEDLEIYASEELKPARPCLLVLNKADMLPVKLRMAWCTFFSRRNQQVCFFSAKQAMNCTSDSSEREDNFNAKQQYDVLNQSELLAYLKQLAPTLLTADKARKVVGLVGYPNVGKSSTINALLGDKKVSVSATPGKTKHFQTLILDDEIELCDCPGLVFPNFAKTRADLICAGVLPIDQLRDARAPVGVVGRRISREKLESVYGFKLPGRGLLRADELLETHARARGFTTDHMGLDIHRSARAILKDYINGVLVFCETPPGSHEEEAPANDHSTKPPPPKETNAAKKPTAALGEETDASTSAASVGVRTAGSRRKGSRAAAQHANGASYLRTVRPYDSGYQP